MIAYICHYLVSILRTHIDNLILLRCASDIKHLWYVQMQQIQHSTIYYTNLVHASFAAIVNTCTNESSAANWNITITELMPVIIVNSPAST